MEQYRRGNKSPLRDLQLAVPDGDTLSQAASSISRNFAPSNTPTPAATNRTAPNQQGGTLDKMLAQLTELTAYMSDPKNRQAVISREMQLEFEEQEEFLRNVAALK